ncbi:MTPC4 [Scenedesmus sp. PABB004]|nr:MTPC4 [Scenedesmus sp. PABB004]
MALRARLGGRGAPGGGGPGAPWWAEAAAAHPAAPRGPTGAPAGAGRAPPGASRAWPRDGPPGGARCSAAGAARACGAALAHARGGGAAAPPLDGPPPPPQQPPRARGLCSLPAGQQPWRGPALPAARPGWQRRGGAAAGALLPPPRAAAAAAAAAGFSASGPAPAPGGGEAAPGAADDDGPEGELHAVETAIRANALIFAAKLGVFFVSSSSAMLAEAVHSLVDIANQMLLRVGIMKAQRQPTEMHPYGYARDQFIWPLISAVGIFCCGAGVSFVHGVTALFEGHRELGDLYWNFVGAAAVWRPALARAAAREQAAAGAAPAGAPAPRARACSRAAAAAAGAAVLGVSAVLESHSLYVAVSTLRRRAAAQGMGLLAYVRTGADPAAVAVMMEDGAAVAGLVVAGGCLALCQVTGAVYWDAVGSIAVSGLLGVVAVTLIQRNRKWLIGKSMPKAQEDIILDHLANDCVIRQVSNIKSEELGVRQYRFQADIAFDGEELARRALDRCGRTRLFKALDAAVRRHDPHALDALLMQFAAVIVSTTGAEVDRLEREIMRMVPGTRWVDLETDRGKPAARLSSAVAAAAVAAVQQAGAGAGAAAGVAAALGEAGQPVDAAALEAAAAADRAQREQLGLELQQQQWAPPPAHDVGADGDHLADLAEYPLGSLMSFDDVHDNVPEWIRAFAPDHAADRGSGAPGDVDGRGDRPPGGGGARLAGADGALAGGNALSTASMEAIEASLFEGDAAYKPFCNSMLEQLQPGGGLLGGRADAEAVAAGNARWDMRSASARDAATQLQLADWRASEARSRTHGPRGGAAAAARSPARPAPGASAGGRTRGAGRADWGAERKRRKMQELLELEDSVIGANGPPVEQAYTPFCESMFQQLHPDAPPLRRSAAGRAARAAEAAAQAAREAVERARQQQAQAQAQAQAPGDDGELDDGRETRAGGG